MWLCPNCFEKCAQNICHNCKQTIVIEERYTLKHCVKVIPRMCFEGNDLQKNKIVFLYQKNDLSWCVIPSPEDIDIKQVHNDIQNLEDMFHDHQKHRKSRNKKNKSLYITEEPLDPLEPEGVSQFVIQLPSKRGWWDQSQSQNSWKQAKMHPALILVCIAIFIVLINIAILFFLT